MIRVIVACFGLMFFTNAARAETIIVVADIWCPYNCEIGAFKPGIMLEIAQKAFAKHHIKIDYRIIPWSRAIEETRKGTYHAIIGAAKEDAPDFIFPQTEQSKLVNTFYVKKGNPWHYGGIGSLDRITLGVIADYSYSEQLDEYIKTNRRELKKVQVISGDDPLKINVRKLLADRIGVLIEAEYVMQYVLQEDNLGAQIEKAGILPETDSNKLYVAFSPKNSQSERYAKILSEETAKMQKNGELSAIMKRYGLTE